ncbi:hypothetical protein PUNSTDRAFT_141172 [Punctularia strigosozonata HHB-11173 SS5]|uniref:uncharacterized protein n=1 Tax=Punctularia strigosozonata (strain HHB-11173) TaxID=741275 RepID=UPI00044176A8|nr:uncharacterized protein PUNSTDRAFT_141172 [Punctularia strigosozonata HHB-11173 SS5]EIN12481.1 hypothetical protein PUNSTDRAFT_141172 [Punctularia strigosozonata HHB-11173 SS5]
MRRLPPEIIDIIIEHACSTDHRAAPVLLLVSKSIHTLTLRHRYHSVALYGFSALRDFLRHLEAAALEHRRIIRLLVSDRPRGACMAKQRPVLDTSRRNRKRFIAALKTLLDRESNSGVEAFSCILFDCYPSDALQDALQHIEGRFPALQDAGIYQGAGGEHGLALALIPRLRRLTLVNDDSGIEDRLRLLSMVGDDDDVDQADDNAGPDISAPAQQERLAALSTETAGVFAEIGWDRRNSFAVDVHVGCGASCVVNIWESGKSTCRLA